MGVHAGARRRGSARRRLGRRAGAGSRPDTGAHAAAARGAPDHRRRRRPAPASAARRPRAGVRERALRLPPDVPPHPAVDPGERPRVLSPRDHAVDRPADRLSALQLPAGARARAQGDGLRRVRHGLEPHAGPRPARRRLHPPRARPGGPTAHRVVLVGAPAAPDPDAGGEGRPRRLSGVHADDERDRAAASVVGQPRERGPDHARRASRAAGRRAGGDRQPALGDGVPPRAGRLPDRARPPTGTRARDHRGGRAARPRRAADPPHRREVDRVRHGQPALEPDRRLLPARDAGRDARAPASPGRRERERVERISYTPTWVRHPDFTVLRAGRANRASYRRTVAVAGRARHLRPLP